MAWINVLIATVFEISWAERLKYYQGVTQLKSSIFTVFTMILSYVYLSPEVKYLLIGTAYEVWTGIGAVGTPIYGILYFKKPCNLPRLPFIFLTVIGIVGLRFTYQAS